ncbi:MAG: dTMP kinase [Acidimicrobiales bacterium]
MVESSSTARFIVLEGGEASGKSTQAARLAQAMGAVLTREPGGTPLGERIRSLLLDPAATDISARAEALLMMAARAQHVQDVIVPALAAGRDVVCDRFAASTLAYQGFGRGLDPEQLTQISFWASAGLVPDRVILLVVPPSVARARLKARRADRIESEEETFFERVTGGFVALASADPLRWRIVDGTGDPDEVELRVRLAAFEQPSAAES